ncbi:MAG: LPS biosynthesis choline kinase, partial [Bacteroidota bacterium]
MNSLMQDPRLKSIRAQVPALADATNITALGGGLTNMNYRVDTPNGIYMMRVSDTATNLLGINRDNEKVNTERACKAGVGPAVIDSLPAENV